MTVQTDKAKGGKEDFPRHNEAQEREMSWSSRPFVIPLRTHVSETLNSQGDVTGRFDSGALCSRRTSSPSGGRRSVCSRSSGTHCLRDSYHFGSVVSNCWDAGRRWEEVETTPTDPPSSRGTEVGPVETKESRIRGSHCDFWVGRVKEPPDM